MLCEFGEIVASCAGRLASPKITSGMPTQGPVMIDFRESQVLERQMPQALDRDVGRVSHGVLIEQLRMESSS